VQETAWVSTEQQQACHSAVTTVRLNEQAGAIAGRTRIRCVCAVVSAVWRDGLQAADAGRASVGRTAGDLGAHVRPLALAGDGKRLRTELGRALARCGDGAWQARAQGPVATARASLNVWPLRSSGQHDIGASKCGSRHSAANCQGVAQGSTNSHGPRLCRALSAVRVIVGL
jgi:hypothetical protein